jgi:hypothetical protein
MVTKKYFYNQGTGTLTAGNVIKFVDYVETDGNSYIDTEYIANKDSEFEYTYYTSIPNTWYFGSRTNTSGGGVGFGWHANMVYSSFGSVFVGQKPLSGVSVAGVKNTVILNKNSLLINGVDCTSIAGFGDTFATKTVKLFTIDSTVSLDTRIFTGQCYGWKIREYGVLIQDLRPCIVASQACFYDMVTGKVFTNAGTGTLKASPRFVESIVFDGASYINTGIIGKSGISAEYNVYIPSSNIETANVLITGSRISSGDTRFYLGVVIHPYGKCWGLGIGTDYYQAKNIPTGDKYYYIQANTSSSGGELIVDGETVATTTATIDTGLNMYMGGVNNYGTPRLSGSEGLKFTYYKLYHDGTLIQDLRPYVDENGTACFKDLVTGKLFYNQGTGTLGYTEE